MDSNDGRSSENYRRAAPSCVQGLTYIGQVKDSPVRSSAHLNIVVGADLEVGSASKKIKCLPEYAAPSRSFNEPNSKDLYVYGVDLCERSIDKAAFQAASGLVRILQNGSLSNSGCLVYVG